MMVCTDTRLVFLICLCFLYDGLYEHTWGDQLRVRRAMLLIFGVHLIIEKSKKFGWEISIVTCL